MSLILRDGKSLSDLQATATYIHHQDISSAVWTVNHKLGKYPSVTCVESTGEVIHGSTRYLSSDTVTITFLGAITGKVYLN
jgi:hypothetical protein